MEIISDKKQFFDTIKDFEYIPFTQTEGWYNYHNTQKPGKIIFLVDNIHNPSIACFAHEKKFFSLKMLMISGEALVSELISWKQIQTFYKDITALGYDFIEVNSLAIYNSKYETGIRKAGYLRPVGLFSSTQSILIDLEKELSFDKNWKKNLKLATKQNLSFEVIEKIEEKHIREFFLLYQHLLKDKGFENAINEKQIKELLSSSFFGMANVRDSQNLPQAYFIFYKRGKYAESLFRAKSDTAKQNGASFYLYFKLLEYLRMNGFKSFDMGKISPGVKGKDGVANFKLGINGSYIIYNGEWSWYKKSFYRPLMYFVKKYLFKKIEV